MRNSKIGLIFGNVGKKSNYCLIARRKYIFLKIHGFVVRIDIGGKQRKDHILGIHYLREILVFLKINSRRISFNINLRHVLNDTCPLCGLNYETFDELEKGAHESCEQTIKRIRGGK